MCVLAGIIAMAVMAGATPFDTHIMIDRALNSPTLTIRYTGAHAALVELRINGDSIGTRSLTGSKDSGETNFNISLTDLKDGDNEVEVRLFDRTGKQIGSEKSSILADQSNSGPVFLSAPKVGATVRGPVEIKMDFNRQIKDSMVSFFIDSNFRAMSNYPPYSYIWDTTRETNGWHEVQAWDVDDASITYKTRKTRVFIDNPGGPTNRPGVSQELSPSKPVLNANAPGADRGVKPLSGHGLSRGSENLRSVAPRDVPMVSINPIHAPVVGGAGSLEPAPRGKAIATGPRILAPTGRRNASTAHAKDSGTIKIDVHAGKSTVAAVAPHTQQVPNVRDLSTVAHTISIQRGQRVPNIGEFAIELNSQYVKFDVQPRVDDGVPMTPIRYLLEKDGGKVKWENMTKTVTASADGKSIVIQIGDRNAKVDQYTVSMEVTPYIDRGRTIVPLSFIHDALGVNIEYDKETGHVLITSATK